MLENLDDKTSDLQISDIRHQTSDIRLQISDFSQLHVALKLMTEKIPAVKPV